MNDTGEVLTKNNGSPLKMLYAKSYTTLCKKKAKGKISSDCIIPVMTKAVPK